MPYEHQKSKLNRNPQKKQKLWVVVVTLAILKVEETQAGEGVGNEGEIGVCDARVEGARRGLGEIKLVEAAESGGHLAEHVGPGAGAELAPLGALQTEPTLANQTEHLFLLGGFKPR